MTKEEIKNIKKTADAYGTVSEEKAEEKVETQTEDMIEKSHKDDNKTAETEKKEAIEEAVEKDEKKIEEKIDMRKMSFEERKKIEEKRALLRWVPKTKLGLKVKDKEITKLDDILDNDLKIMESEIIDTLVKTDVELISIGQAKGKFGGGKRRPWRQTQRASKQGNIMTFSSMAVVGDKRGHVGVGVGKASETLPGRDKAVRKAKLNIMRINRACAAFDCDCSLMHTVPFKVEGKAGSVVVTLTPAPQGTGLVCAKELRKVLSLAGIKDVYSRTSGRQRTTFNLVKACIEALKMTTSRENTQ